MGLLAAHQHPGVGRPLGEADQVGDLGHRAGFANLATVGGNRCLPSGSVQRQDYFGQARGSGTPAMKRTWRARHAAANAWLVPPASVRTITC